MPIGRYPAIQADALITRYTKTFIADVGDNQVEHLQPVVLVRSDGMRLALRNGVKAGDRVALNVTNEAVDGGDRQPLEGR